MLFNKNQRTKTHSFFVCFGLARDNSQKKCLKKQKGNTSCRKMWSNFCLSVDLFFCPYLFPSCVLTQFETNLIFIWFFHSFCLFLYLFASFYSFLLMYVTSSLSLSVHLIQSQVIAQQVLGCFEDEDCCPVRYLMQLFAKLDYFQSVFITKCLFEQSLFFGSSDQLKNVRSSFK